MLGGFIVKLSPRFGAAAGVTSHNDLTDVTVTNHHDPTTYGWTPFGRFQMCDYSQNYEASADTIVAGRCHMTPISIPYAVVVDGIFFHSRINAAGNVRAAIYAEGSTQDSPAGGALMCESASVGLAGSFAWTLISLPETTLSAGLYFLAIQDSVTTDEFFSTYDVSQLVAWYFDRAGGFGAYPDPCPAVASKNNAFICGIRIKSVPKIYIGA